jgi:transcriptional/translational regulatory protein YebC/TACO1
MSGHSKWSTIKHKKAKVDAQKGVTFAKYAREITVAAKMGGCDPSANFRLRTAVEKAKESGLPNDNIKRALEKASGIGGSDNIEELSYEG